ncbi:MAG TPA: hypothetical protein VFM54_09305 [Micromonosporaceae bacterium]|nr:hypothetical protein [Micromonosporaceae bacterium]
MTQTTNTIEIETTDAIAHRWRREGRTFRVREAVAENLRQTCAAALTREAGILTAAELPDTDELTRQVAQQIRDHRECNGAEHALNCTRQHP